MNKSIIIGVVLLILIAGGIYFLTYEDSSTDEISQVENTINQNSNSPTPIENSNDVMVEEISSTTYTLSEVATHDEVSDCWMVLNDRVYDVTDYINSHPGGSSIIPGCGTDATDIFEQRPNGSGSHSANAVDISQDYLIGDLN